MNKSKRQKIKACVSKHLLKRISLCSDGKDSIRTSHLFSVALTKHEALIKYITSALYSFINILCFLIVKTYIYVCVCKVSYF
jgi:hypothetical protein